MIFYSVSLIRYARFDNRVCLCFRILRLRQTDDCGNARVCYGFRVTWYEICSIMGMVVKNVGRCGMKLFEEKGNCCGCTACMSICPRGAIRMEPDAEGFLYPQVDDEKCVNCGLCKTVCVFQNGYEREETEPKQTGYAVKHKKEEVREASRSGGMFTAISDYILESGGTIYGAGYGEHFKVIHKSRLSSQDRRDFLTVILAET